MNKHKFRFHGAVGPYQIHPHDASANHFVEYNPNTAVFSQGLNVVSHPTSNTQIDIVTNH